MREHLLIVDEAVAPIVEQVIDHATAAIDFRVWNVAINLEFDVSLRKIGVNLTEKADYESEVGRGNSNLATALEHSVGFTEKSVTVPIRYMLEHVLREKAIDTLIGKWQWPGGIQVNTIPGVDVGVQPSLKGIFSASDLELSYGIAIEISGDAPPSCSQGHAHSYRLQ